MLHDLLQRLRRTAHLLVLPRAAREERRRDLRDGLADDPGPAAALRGATAWLERAQDRSTSRDGGVARHYSLLTGWSASYPETTGYIVPTLLDLARREDRPDLRARARRMLDWLVTIQHPAGGFQGGMIDQTPRVPVTFNTGQILLGLAAGTAAFGEMYRGPMTGAADWLVATQEPDGAWRRHATPFALAGEKVYETHVAWGLFEAARVQPNAEWVAAAIRNVDWAVRQQHPNGWLPDCCLDDPSRPLTHTIGYALRGILEAHRHTRETRFLDAAVRTADGVLGALHHDGCIAGRLDSLWRDAVLWSCLTGTAQVSVCWLQLFRLTGNQRYREAASSALCYLRRTIRGDGSPDQAGGVTGSFPVTGGYGRYEYLSWAAKFFIDAQLLELDLAAGVS